jgi:hypothetical protein
MKYFLIVYNRKTGDVQMRRFPAEQRAAAMRARFKAEQSHLDDPEIEVVVLGSASKENLKRTHGRYFSSTGDLLRGAQATLTGLAASTRRLPTPHR